MLSQWSVIQKYVKLPAVIVLTSVMDREIFAATSLRFWSTHSIGGDFL